MHSSAPSHDVAPTVFSLALRASLPCIQQPHKAGVLQAPHNGGGRDVVDAVRNERT